MCPNQCLITGAHIRVRYSGMIRIRISDPRSFAPGTFLGEEATWENPVDLNTHSSRGSAAKTIQHFHANPASYASLSLAFSSHSPSPPPKWRKNQVFWVCKIASYLFTKCPRPWTWSSPKTKLAILSTWIEVTWKLSSDQAPHWGKRE